MSILNTIQDQEALQEAQHVSQLVELFNRLFQPSLNTILVIGADEPEYIPSEQQGSPHRIIFAHGFFASALHETAHWCIASAERRKKRDFGYWYKPDGRNAIEQILFEQVEAKPQALEWIFAKACGRSFRLSADNVESGCRPTDAFKSNVYAQLLLWLNHGLNERSLLWVNALANTFNQGVVPTLADFNRLELR